MSTPTPIFRIKAADYASVYIRRYIGRVAACAALPVLALALVTVATSDWRFAVVAFVLITLVYPPVLACAWLAILAHPDAARGTRPQRWTFSPDGAIEIQYYAYDADSDEAGDVSPVDSLHVAPGGIKALETRRSNTIVFMAEPTKARAGQYIMIPTTLLPLGCVQKIQSLIDE